MCSRVACDALQCDALHCEMDGQNFRNAHSNASLSTSPAHRMAQQQQQQRQRQRQQIQTCAVGNGKTSTDCTAGGRRGCLGGTTCWRRVARCVDNSMPIKLSQVSCSLKSFVLHENESWQCVAPSPSPGAMLELNWVIYFIWYLWYLILFNTAHMARFRCLCSDLDDWSNPYSKVATAT